MLSPTLLAAIILPATLVLSASAAGWFGWQLESRNVYRRSLLVPDMPDGMTRDVFERQERRRRKARRAVMTVAYSLAGAMAGFAVLVILATRH
jgi:hypothetical protein